MRISLCWSGGLVMKDRMHLKYKCAHLATGEGDENRSLHDIAITNVVC